MLIPTNNLYLNVFIKSNLNVANTFDETFDLNPSSESCLTKMDGLECNNLNQNTSISDNISNNDQNFTEKLKNWDIKYKIKKNALDALLEILRMETIGKNLHITVES